MPAAPRPPRRPSGGGGKPGGPDKRSGGARKSSEGPKKAYGAKKAAPKPPHKQAPKQWGGVARRGTRNLETAKPGSAAAEFRKAADAAERERTEKRGARSSDDQDLWIDDGPVRDEAAAAVKRGATGRGPRKKGMPTEVAAEVGKAAGPNWAERVTARLGDAARAYEAERFRDARRILEQLLERTPGATPVRELLGLTYYRMGKWRDAIRELGAVELLTGSVDHHPVLADCYRGLKQFTEVERLWDELRQTGASVDVTIEGRIVMAGALADQGRLADAVRLLEAGPRQVRKPQEHHLRLWYALAALYEQAGDVPRARSLFTKLVQVDPEFADALPRLESLGG
jgi:tetratricopeptide (TPR) repeat protein